MWRTKWLWERVCPCAHARHHICEAYAMRFVWFFSIHSGRSAKDNIRRAWSLPSPWLVVVPQGAGGPAHSVVRQIAHWCFSHSRADTVGKGRRRPARQRRKIFQPQDRAPVCRATSAARNLGSESTGTNYPSRHLPRGRARHGPEATGAGRKSSCCARSGRWVTVR